MREIEKDKKTQRQKTSLWITCVLSTFFVFYRRSWVQLFCLSFIFLIKKRLFQIKSRAIGKKRTNNLELSDIISIFATSNHLGE